MHRVYDDDRHCIAECSSPDVAEFIAHSPTDMGKLIAAVDAVLAACATVIDNTDGHKPPGPPHPTQQQATAVRIRAALIAALETT